MVIEENGLAGLEHNLNNTTKAVRKEALWAISNITAGNQSQIGAVLSRNSLVEKLFTIAVTDAVEVNLRLNSEPSRGHLVSVQRHQECKL